MAMKAIVGGRVIDGNGCEPIENGVVLVDGERIQAVGKAVQVEVPEDAGQINAAGKTVMPGIIDGHIHITSMPEFLDRMGHLTQNLQAVRKLHQSLMRGVTTVANMGGCPENVVLRDAIDEGYIHGVSRMLVGAMVNATGGHVRGRTADGPWEVRKAVREMITARADFIKTAASGGFMWKHEKVEWPDYSLEELEALTFEAHSRDKLVAVHAHSQPGLSQAIEAGCDVIAHGALIDQAALDGIAEKGLFFMPTLYITSHHVINRPNLPEHMKERMSHAHSIHREGVRKAHEMGITICVGTDGGPGDAMIELEELVSCGLSPMDAIVAGTRNSARSIGIIEETGTLEKGKLADLIVVNGDPLADITGMAEEGSIQLVMRRGAVEKGPGGMANG